jgi:rifampicin phosphotransferase
MRADETSLVREFARVDAGMLALVGGKGANLGEMTRAGLPVPPGFCLTTEAYRAVAAGAGLEPVLDALARTSAEDLSTLADLAGQARDHMLAAPVPAAIGRAVVAAYRQLGENVPVAVRSSATAEDLPSASFAGQQDTYLNVVGADALQDAIRRCWASLWTDRAVAYRAVNGIDHRQVRLAVVVQRMVESQVAGVLFTANPVTGRREQAVVDASPGLGEAVVSGAVNPDHFVVDPPSGEILERRLGDKRLAIRGLAGGGTEHVTLASGADQACLDDRQIRELAALGQRVQAHYRSPQDIEWALDGSGRLWLTQARPITTLFPLPSGVAARRADLSVYFCFSVAQGLNRPITPMGLAAFRLFASSVAHHLFGFSIDDPLAGPSRYVEAGQRVFIDFTPVVRSQVGRALAPRILGVMEARSAVVLGNLMEDPRLSVVYPRWPVVRRMLAVAAKFRVPPRFLRAALHPVAARAHVTGVGERLRSRLPPPAGASDLERLDHVQRILHDEVIPLMPAIAPAAGAGFALLALARRLLVGDLQPGELQVVLRGLPHNVTTEMDLALWQLSTRIRAQAAELFSDLTPAQLAGRFRAGALPPPVQAEVEAFLAQWGHRAVAEIDLGLPRWSEDPEHVLGVVANYLRLDPTSPAAPDAQFARASAEAEAMIGELTARARRRGRLRGWVVRRSLQNARQLAGLREMPKYLMIVALSAMREQLAAVGANLAAAGRLEQGDDVFFVDLEEVRRGLGGEDLRPTVQARRQAYEQESRRRHVPRVLLSDGTEPEALSLPRVAAEGVLVGTAASAGSVTAGARVVLDPVGARLEPGEILVAPSTDPGWTPLFLTAGGLVMEMGGSNSHGAVVAREYGIPAVVGVADATLHIRTGQHITVDGSAGTVTPA